MEKSIRSFVTIDSIYGPFIINRHCAFQAESLIKSGRPHIQAELDVLLKVVDQLPADCIVVDGGANAGLVCVPLAKRLHARGGQVHAFEPQRTLYYGLCGTIALGELDNLHAYNMGLSSRNTTMFISKIDYTQNTDFGTISLESEQPIGGSPVAVVRLDSLGFKRLDFLKLDVEGMEIEALRGARHLLRAHLPWCWIEYWKVGLHLVMAEFHGLNYTFFRIDALNLLCVPLAKWDRENFMILGEQIVYEVSDLPKINSSFAASLCPPEVYWNEALEHEQRCEWGRALLKWRLAYGKGLDDVSILLDIASCLDFSGNIDAGLSVINNFKNLNELPKNALEKLYYIKYMLLLRSGHLAEAAQARNQCEHVKTLPLFVEMGLPLEKIYTKQPIAGKRILVMGYGGAGDQIQYSRYFKNLRNENCSSIVVVTSSALLSFFQHNFPSIEFLVGEGGKYDCSLIKFDYWCTFLTLATSFDFEPGIKQSVGQPYLECADNLRQEWATWIAAFMPIESNYLLGMNWQGEPSSDMLWHRASSMRDFAPLARMSNTFSVCLNRDVTATLDFDSTSFVFPGNLIRNFDDLAAVMMSMDAVVTTCTAQVHLAGALGIPSILVLGPKADPRWGTGQITDLYPSVRIVRASRAGQWDDAIDQAMCLIGATFLPPSVLGVSTAQLGHQA